MLLKHISFEDASEQLDVRTTTVFPQIIHQFWFGIENPTMPDAWQKNFDLWTNLHPEWIHVLWSRKDAEDCIKTCEPEFYSTYINFKYEIQRIDSVRYCMLKRFGGIYADLDMYPIKPIDKLFLNSTCEVYALHSALTTDTYTNALFGCIKNAPVMSDMINSMMYANNKPIWAIGKFLTVMYTTGPNAFTKVLEKFKNVVCTLPSSVTNNEYGASPTPETYVLNTNGSTWHGFDAKFVKFVTIHKILCACLTVFILSAIIFGCIFYYSKRAKKCELSLMHCSHKVKLLT